MLRPPRRARTAHVVPLSAACLPRASAGAAFVTSLARSGFIVLVHLFDVSRNCRLIVRCSNRRKPCRNANTNNRSQSRRSQSRRSRNSRNRMTTKTTAMTTARKKKTRAAFEKSAMLPFHFQNGNSFTKEMPNLCWTLVAGSPGDPSSGADVFYDALS